MLEFSLGATVQVSLVSPSWVPGGSSQTLHPQSLGEVGGPLQRNHSVSYQAAFLPLPTLLLQREEGREVILEGHTEARKMAS